MEVGNNFQDSGGAYPAPSKAVSKHMDKEAAKLAKVEAFQKVKLTGFSKSEPVIPFPKDILSRMTDPIDPLRLNTSLVIDLLRPEEEAFQLTLAGLRVEDVDLPPPPDIDALLPSFGEFRVPNISAAPLETFVQPLQRGEVIEATFQYGDLTLTEKAVRTRVVPQLKNSYEDQIEDLQERWRSGQRDTRTFHRIEAVKESYYHAKQAVEEGRTWASSFSFRSLLRRCNSVGAAFAAYLPVLVNVRVQTLTTQDNAVLSTVVRSGAIHDYRHGETSLPELQKLRDDLSGKIDQPLTRRQISRCRRIIPSMKMMKSEEVGSIKRDILLEQIDRTIWDRELALEHQALQDLRIHCDNLMQTEGGLGTDNTLALGRVSMLDGTKRQERGGSFLSRLRHFVINEKNQILDMQAIYEKLQGKELIFDGKGPFVDEDGKVHMPISLTDDEGNTLTKTLDYIYFNISTQGNVANEDPQRAINQAAIRSLEPLFRSRYAELERLGKAEEAASLHRRFFRLRDTLRDGIRDGNKTAEDAAMLLKECAQGVSLNCFSGKDRTGLMAAMMTFEGMYKCMMKRPLEGITDRGTELMQRVAQLGIWSRSLMGRHGVARKITRDNTGYSAIKLSVMRIPLFVVGGTVDLLLGVARRISLFITAGATFFIRPSAHRQGEGAL